MRPVKRFQPWLIAIVWLLGLATVLPAQQPGAAGFRLPAIFSDHMVIQRDKPVTVWGWGPAGSRVRVAIAGRTATGTVDAAGSWRVQLPALRAGGPHVLTVSGPETRTYRDVLVGDVWLASGQSNMEWPLMNTTGAEEDIASASHPRIRLFTVAHDVSDSPKQDVVSEGWKVASPTTVPRFSAIAYHFGVRLQKELGIPIGLLHSSWGGTLAEAWTSPAALSTLSDFAAPVRAIQPGSISVERQREMDREFAEQTAAWQREAVARDTGYAAGGRPWTAAEYDASGWRTMNLPGVWESGALPGFDGVVWLRREVDVPAGLAGRELTLHLGRVHDSDSVWVNGAFLGHNPSNGAAREYPVRAGLFRAGRNLITVRVVNPMGAGGIYGEPDQLALRATTGESVSLAGPWRFRPTVDFASTPRPPRRPGLHNQPTALYNAMIAPLVQFPIRGVIWYQGESNAGRAAQYRTLFPTLIRDWRNAWGIPDLPFLFVQLANYMPRQSDPNTRSAWAELREAQTMTLSLPNTAMATIIDLGEADDIHPRNKRDVATRLALGALKTVYGRTLVHSGPTFREMRREPGAIRLCFDNTGGGLVSRAGTLRGFAIAGADRKFEWADAAIDGPCVVVSSRKVREPVAVRYGWGDNPEVDLYNREGLPAVPFRTDDW